MKDKVKTKLLLEIKKWNNQNIENKKNKIIKIY